MKNRLSLLAGILLVLLLPTQLTAAPDLQQGVEELARQIAGEMKDQGKRTLAVVEFVDLDGSVNQFGQFLAEKLITRLFTQDPGQFMIIERRQLMRVIAEQKLSVSGLVDKASIGKIASTLGVDAIVTGTIALYGDEVEINARCLSVETAMVFAAAATTIPKTEKVADMLIQPGSYADPSAGSSENLDQPSRRQSSPPEAQTYSGHGFTFSLVGCSRSGESVTCSLVITSDAQDKDLMLIGWDRGEGTRLFDNFGHEHRARRVALGREQGSGWESKMMIQGIPIDASFTFQGLAPQSTGVAVLEVMYYAGGPRARFKFRDIAFPD